VPGTLANSGWQTVAWQGTNLTDFAKQYGTPVPSRAGSPLVDVLIPMDPEAAPKQSLSAEAGFSAFPWHTDGAHWRIPPRFIVMRLAPGAATLTPTRLLTIDRLGLGEDLTVELRRTILIVSSGRGAFLAPLLQRRPSLGLDTIRFDRRVMRPRLKKSVGALDALEESLSRSDPEAVYWDPGSVLVLDNWRAVHMRDAVPDEERSTRKLERVLVMADAA
jgi:hypothetical protein